MSVTEKLLVDDSTGQPFYPVTSIDAVVDNEIEAGSYEWIEVPIYNFLDDSSYDSTRNSAFLLDTLYVPCSDIGVCIYGSWEEFLEKTKNINAGFFYDSINKQVKLMSDIAEMFGNSAYILGYTPNGRDYAPVRVNDEYDTIIPNLSPSHFVTALRNIDFKAVAALDFDSFGPAFGVLVQTE